MLRIGFAIPALVVAGLLAVGCKSSHEDGVKSTYLSQTVQVAADVKTTTEAGRAVLEEEDLKNIEFAATNIDGTATGRKANGAVVTVTVAKSGDGSSAKVSVGALGDPDLGAEMARRIKDRAESRATTRPAVR